MFVKIVSVLSYQSEIQSDVHSLAHAGAFVDEPRQERLSLLRRLLPTVVVLIVAGGVVLAVLGIWADRPRAHFRLDVVWLLPAIVGLAALELTQAELWRRLLGTLGGTLDMLPALAIWCVSAVARYVPSSMLMPVVRVRMSRGRGVRGDICLTSVLYESVLVTCGALYVGAYVIVVLPSLRGDVWRWGVLVLPLAAIGVLHPRLFELLSARALRRLGRLPLPKHLSMKQLLGFTTAYAMSFLLAGASLIAVVMMLHPLTWQGAPTVIGAMAIGFVASVFAFLLPGGLGAREAALVVTLSTVLPTVVATAVAVAARLIQLGIEVILALFLPWVLHRRDARRATSRDG